MIDLVRGAIGRGSGPGVCRTRGHSPETPQWLPFAHRSFGEFPGVINRAVTRPSNCPTPFALPNGALSTHTCKGY